MFRTIHDRNKLFREIKDFKSSISVRGKPIAESKHLWRDNPDLQAWLKGEPIRFIDNAITQDLEVISSEYQLNIFKFILNMRKSYFINGIWKDNKLLVSNILNLSAADLESLLLRVMISHSTGTSSTIKEFLALVNDAQVINNVISEISKKGVHSVCKKNQVGLLNERLNAINNLVYLHANEFGRTHNEISTLPHCPEIVFDCKEELSSEVNHVYIEESAFNRALLKRKPSTELKNYPKRQNTNVLSPTISEVHPARLREIPPPVMLVKPSAEPVAIPPSEMLQARVLTLEAIAAAQNNTPCDDANLVRPIQDSDFKKEFNEIMQHSQSQNSSPTLFGYAYGCVDQSFALNSDISSVRNLLDEDEDEFVSRYLNLK